MTNKKKPVDPRIITFRQNIAKWRKFAGLTQTELASKMAYSRQGLQRIENGRMDADLDFVLRIIDCSGLSFKALINPLELAPQKNEHKN